VAFGSSVWKERPLPQKKGGGLAGGLYAIGTNGGGGFVSTRGFLLQPWGEDEEGPACDDQKEEVLSRVRGSPEKTRLILRAVSASFAL